MSTAQQSLVSVYVDGGLVGTFDTLDTSSFGGDNPKHRPGGMGKEKVYGALPSQDSITCGRVMERERDIERIRSLRPRVNRADATVVDQPLDDDGNVWGKPTTYTGKLSSISITAVDSNSSELRMVSMAFTVADVA